MTVIRGMTPMSMWNAELAVTRVIVQVTLLSGFHFDITGLSPLCNHFWVTKIKCLWVSFAWSNEFLHTCCQRVNIVRVHGVSPHLENCMSANLHEFQFQKLAHWLDYSHSELRMVESTPWFLAQLMHSCIVTTWPGVWATVHKLEMCWVQLRQDTSQNWCWSEWPHVA